MVEKEPNFVSCQLVLEYDDKDKDNDDDGQQECI